MLSDSEQKSSITQPLLAKTKRKQIKYNKRKLTISDILHFLLIVTTHNSTHNEELPATNYTSLHSWYNSIIIIISKFFLHQMAMDPAHCHGHIII